MQGENVGLGLTFYRFLVSKSLSTVSWALFTVFFMWKVITVYHSVFLVGLIPTINLLVDLISSVPVGHVIDRHNNTVLSLAASIIMGAGYSLFIFGFSVYLVYLVAAVTSFSSTLKSDSFSAIIKKHVRIEGIGSATSFQQASVSISSLAGFGIGALSLVFMSSFAPYILISFTLFAAALSRPVAEEIRKETRENGEKPGYRNVLSFFRRLVGFILIALVLNGFIVTLDVYGSGLFHIYLHAGPALYAAFVASLPAGMFIGSITANRLMARIEKPFVSAGLIIFYPPVLLILGISNSAFLDIFSVGFLGFILPLINVPMVSRLVRVTPKDIFGRVFAFVKIFLGSSTPVMAALFSVIALAVPLKIVFMAAGIIMIPITILGFRVIRNYYAVTAPLGA